MFARYCGRQVYVDNAVFSSERATGHRNRAIGHLMLNFDMVGNRLEETLELYFQQCSIMVTAHDLAVMGATLANGGVNPITGQRAFHSGVDISAQPGKPVKASAAGVVIRTEEYGGLGRAVHVAHGFGITTVYGHLSRLTVTPGQRLNRGDIVGLVGNTGRATGFHLHYEVQVNGEAVNPLTYMVDRATPAL